MVENLCTYVTETFPGTLFQMFRYYESQIVQHLKKTTLNGTLSHVVVVVKLVVAVRLHRACHVLRVPVVTSTVVVSVALSVVHSFSSRPTFWFLIKNLIMCRCLMLLTFCRNGSEVLEPTPKRSPVADQVKP